MKKRLFIFGIVIIIIVGLFLAADFSRSLKNDSQKLIVVTTSFPLYDFARTIGGDKVEVSLLLPPGIEAHSFEPRPSDIARINTADVFIYTGEFMEPWAQDIIQGTNNKNLKAVNASVGIDLLPSVFHDADEPAGSQDPHIWLDFDNDEQIIRTVVAAFVAQDSVNAVYYQQQAAAYEAQLLTLDAKYQTALSSCAAKKIVYGGHYAFGYLAKRYNLEYFAAQGVSPDAEPSAQDLIDLVTQIKDNDIKYVFYEELTTPKIAEMIAQETSAQLLLLSAAHNVSRDDLEGDKTFLQIMEANLDNLKIGLQCN